VEICENLCPNLRVTVYAKDLAYYIQRIHIFFKIGGIHDSFQEKGSFVGSIIAYPYRPGIGTRKRHKNQR
jgi:hypothetical protein